MHGSKWSINSARIAEMASVRIRPAVKSHVAAAVALAVTIFRAGVLLAARAKLPRRIVRVRPMWHHV